jgi:7-keto-8-aminopelargonate synthetase-like enzyme
MNIHRMTDWPPTLQQTDRTSVLWRGRKLAYFAGCDYFRLASHPAVLKAFQSSAAKYGLNVAASRKTTGNHELYAHLESALVRFFKSGSSVLVSNGYASNLAVAQALSGKFSHALMDARAHSSLVDAAHFLECPTIRFQHRNPEDVARITKRLGAGCRILLLTDGMFAHDGSVAPLEKYLEALNDDSQILVDDAHAAGVLVKNGRGTPEFSGVGRRRIIQTITLSKAFGAYGGAILGSRGLCRAVISGSRLVTGNTPLPLPLAAAALTSVELVGSDDRLRTRLARNTDHVKSSLRQKGISIPENQSPILPIIPANRSAAAKLKRHLFAAGIFPPLIQYPGGPEGGYFRFAISSEHTRKQLDGLIEVLVR